MAPMLAARRTTLSHSRPHGKVALLHVDVPQVPTCPDSTNPQTPLRLRATFPAAREFRRTCFRRHSLSLPCALSRLFHLVAWQLHSPCCTTVQNNRNVAGCRPLCNSPSARLTYTACDQRVSRHLTRVCAISGIGQRVPPAQPDLHIKFLRHHEPQTLRPCTQDSSSETSGASQNLQDPNPGHIRTQLFARSKSEGSAPRNRLRRHPLTPLPRTSYCGAEDSHIYQFRRHYSTAY